jgi:hypothetical protein
MTTSFHALSNSFLIILPFDAIQFKILTASLNKTKIKEKSLRV